MDYSITKTVEGRIEYNVDQAMPYGDMPPSMLMAKHEETNMGPDEDLYDNYARTTLTDWRPDTTKFEHEEARGGVNRNSGMLQLRYYGHRGDADDPYRPEIFDGFMGDEDRDPRGSQVDPDMKELRCQHEARMRFQRFTPDGNESITGGGRSEAQTMADQQTLFRTVRDRLKVFTRQLDGRRNGLRREFQHASDVPKQVRVQSYGDLIKGHALTPQRRANMVTRKLLRDTRAYRVETADAGFHTAKYTQHRRARKKGDLVCRVDPSARTARANEIDDVDAHKNYKAAGLLMSNIIKRKSQVVANATASDTDMATARTAVARKTAPLCRDLELILRSMQADSNFAAGSDAMFVKSPFPTTMEHLGRQLVYNHSAPAHHYINAELMYKNVKPGGDLRKVKDLAVTDATDVRVYDEPSAGKTAKKRIAAGAKLATAQDADRAESRSTKNYRVALGSAASRVRTGAVDQAPGKADASQIRRPNHQKYRSANTDDTEEDLRYGDNTQAKRLGGVMGSKYMNRYIDRDEKRGNIDAMSG